METYPGFEGDIEQWYFECGEGTWQNDPVVPCDDPSACGIDDGDCVILYEDCDYQGRQTNICSDQPFTDINYEVKSILVPDGKTVYLYNMPCFNGESAEIS